MFKSKFLKSCRSLFREACHDTLVYFVDCVVDSCVRRHIALIRAGRERRRDARGVSR